MWRKLLAWLAAQALPTSSLNDATFYSDSLNDLPLLRAVGTPVVVNPDAGLLAEAERVGWRVVRFKTTRAHDAAARHQRDAAREQPGSRSHAPRAWQSDAVQMAADEVAGDGERQQDDP